jgi:hypothetical protein
LRVDYHLAAPVRAPSSKASSELIFGRNSCQAPGFLLNRPKAANEWASHPLIRARTAPTRCARWHLRSGGPRVVMPITSKQSCIFTLLWDRGINPHRTRSPLQRFTRFDWRVSDEEQTGVWRDYATCRSFDIAWSRGVRAGRRLSWRWGISRRVRRFPRRRIQSFCRRFSWWKLLRAKGSVWARVRILWILW